MEGGNPHLDVKEKTQVEDPREQEYRCRAEVGSYHSRDEISVMEMERKVKSDLNWLNLRNISLPPLIVLGSDALFNKFRTLIIDCVGSVLWALI